MCLFTGHLFFIPIHAQKQPVRKVEQLHRNVFQTQKRTAKSPHHGSNCHSHDIANCLSSCLTPSNPIPSHLVVPCLMPFGTCSQCPQPGGLALRKSLTKSKPSCIGSACPVYNRAGSLLTYSFPIPPCSIAFMACVWFALPLQCVM